MVKQKQKDIDINPFEMLILKNTVFFFNAKLKIPEAFSKSEFKVMSFSKLPISLPYAQNLKVKRKKISYYTLTVLRMQNKKMDL